ncbi:hypothetical protein OA90_25365 [Labrenzia sp. OB1]|nr:hypothetical protein OA90_25365 [Labrenzia sp. OB1]
MQLLAAGIRSDPCRRANLIIFSGAHRPAGSKIRIPGCVTIHQPVQPFRPEKKHSSKNRL